MNTFGQPTPVRNKAGEITGDRPSACLQACDGMGNPVAEVAALKKKSDELDSVALNVNTLTECVAEWGFTGKTLHHCFAKAHIELQSLRSKLKAAEGLATVLKRVGLNEFEDTERTAALDAWQKANK